jgi:membrane fusion protein (multidrug efflux system)
MEPAKQQPRARSKRWRYLLVAIGLFIVVGGLAFAKFAQISSLMAAGGRMAKAGPPPEVVSTSIAQQQAWGDSLSAVGSVVTAKGVAVTNDAAGVVSKIYFESGTLVKQGQPLVELDSDVERAQLASAKARLDLANLNAGRSRSLAHDRVIAQAQLDADEAQLKSARTEHAAIAAQIERKIVRAPFAGRLGIRHVNLGQYLSPGTVLTELEAEGALYIDFSLPQQELSRLKVGMPVRISANGAPRDAQGKDESIALNGLVSAVDPTLDNISRAVKVRAGVENAQDKLKPGMFVNVALVLPEVDQVVVVPATAVVHASYGDSIFVVADKPQGSPGIATTPDGKPVKLAQQRFVRLGQARGDFVAVLEGVKPGEEVVSAGAFKLRNGGSLVVDNSVQAKAELNPRPENK